MTVTRRPVAIYLGITVAISLLAIFCASRMKSALGTARPGGKAPDPQPARGYYGADLSRPAARSVRGPGGRSAPAGNRYPRSRGACRPGKAPPPPGSKAAPEPTIPPGGAALARGPGRSRRGGYRLSQVRKHVGPVRCQPPPGRNRRQVFPLLSRRRQDWRVSGASGCPAEAASRRCFSFQKPQAR